MVKDNRARNRFELEQDGEVAVAEYQREKGLVIFTHTRVPPALEGRGVGSRLARGALDAVRAEGLKVLPLCPFIKAYIAKHEAYQDLLVTRT